MSNIPEAVRQDPIVQQTLAVLKEAYESLPTKPNKTFDEIMGRSHAGEKVIELLAEMGGLDPVTYAATLVNKCIDAPFVKIDAAALAVPDDVMRVINEQIIGSNDAMEELYNNPTTYFNDKSPTFIRLQVSEFISTFNDLLQGFSSVPSGWEKAAIASNMIVIVLPMNTAIKGAKAWRAMPQEMMDRYLSAAKGLCDIFTDPSMKKFMQSHLSELEEAIIDDLSEKKALAGLEVSFEMDPKSAFAKIVNSGKRFKLQPAPKTKRKRPKKQALNRQ